MNHDKIKQLAEQANIAFKDSGHLTQGHTIADLERFAELIIRESMLQAYSHHSQNADYAAGIDDTRERIAEHFGIVQ